MTSAADTSGSGATTSAESTTAGASASTSDGSDSSGGADTSETTETGAAAPTWKDFAAGFMETYCFECHGPGDPMRDYSLLDDVIADAPTIRCGIAPEMLLDCGANPAPGQFPVGAGPKPTDDERSMLVAWIDAGLPE